MIITIKNLQKDIRISSEEAESAVRAVLTAEGIKKSGRINVCFTADKEIRKLNHRYLKKDRPTDVLAFEMPAEGGKRGLYADIIVSTETAARNAKSFKTLPIYEAYLYVIHGVLHILGYNDVGAGGRQLMQNKAERILSTLFHFKPECP